jgi:hypothetical protein
MKFIDKILGKNNDQEFNALIQSLISLRQKSDYVLLTPQPTGYAWLGVYNGGKSMFPDQTIALPHYYSNSIFSPKQLVELGEQLVALKFGQILFNGFPPYFENLIAQITKRAPGHNIGVVYHGFPAELSGSKISLEIMGAMVRACKEKRIRKIGFAKKGFGLAFQQLFGTRSFELIYKNPAPIAGLKKYTDGKIHIGALVNNSFRKNFHTQVMAALMIENSVVHVGDASELDYLGVGNRIVSHGSLAHNDFIRVLGSMDINLHVTFSEASGGQVCSESISQGVPCISGYTSSFFDYNEELKQALIPMGADDPYFIHLKIKEVLSQRESLAKKCLAYSIYLNQLADERISDFLAC